MAYHHDGYQTSSHVIINIEYLENYLRNIDQTLSIIGKVNKHIHDASYSPVLVSIGPYHRKKETLKSMEKKKWNTMDYFLPKSVKNLQDYVKALKKVEHVARNCYTEEIKMDSNAFVNMLLLYGFFTLASLYAIDHKSQNLSDLSMETPNNNYQMEPLQYCFFMHDLFLVENQIPFFVLEIIYELYTGKDNIAPSLSEKITHYMEHILSNYPKSIKGSDRPTNFCHLLHLCHIYLRPSRNDDSYFMYSNQHGQMANCWRRATEYHMAGVEFKKIIFSKNKPHSLLDVRYTNNMLEIPHLTIDENTPSIFKNLIALEQTSPKFGNDITAYIIFMSQLIKDPRDVALLTSKGIIEHDLRGEEEVVDLFMSLSDRIVFDFADSFYLKNICHNLEAYYQSRVKRWNVWFRRATAAIYNKISKLYV